MCPGCRLKENFLNDSDQNATQIFDWSRNVLQ